MRYRAWELPLLERTQMQEGVVARFQLADLGLPPSTWARARQSDRFEALSWRVVRDRGAPFTIATRLMAAVLDGSPGCVLHEAAALGWFELPRGNLRHIKVARVRGVSGMTGTLGELHVIRDLRARDVVVHRGVPSESAIRAIWAYLAPYASEGRRDAGYEIGGQLLDAAHRKGLVTWLALREAVEEVGERGRAGTVIMRALSEERPPGSSPTESRNEQCFEQRMAAANIAGMRRQRTLGGDLPIGRCDFRDDQFPLAVEVNSLLFHSTPTDVANDRRRYNALNVAGFTVAVIWEQDLWSGSRWVAETVREGRRLSMVKPVVLHSPSCPWPDVRTVTDLTHGSGH